MIASGSAPPWWTVCRLGSYVGRYQTYAWRNDSSQSSPARGGTRQPFDAEGGLRKLERLRCTMDLELKLPIPSKRHALGTLLSNTSASEAQTKRGRTPVPWTAAYHLSSLHQFSGVVRRRSPLPEGRVAGLLGPALRIAAVASQADLGAVHLRIERVIRPLDFAVLGYHCPCLPC